MSFIMEKKAEHIAIFQNNKECNYLTEVLPENHINTCFKHDIEKWLRMCFLLDPKIRISRQKTILSDLKNILSKQILIVFSVYTFEFYHYEYNDCTLISTLQDWISRDTKIMKFDQILLTETNVSNKFTPEDLIAKYIKNVITFY